MADVTSQPSKPPVDAFSSLFLSPFKLFGAVPAAPDLTACRQVGVEMVTLATRRTQAMMDIPAKTRQCKSTGDLANVTVEFWQTAWAQQMESASRIAALFGVGMPSPFALSGMMVTGKAAPVRDMLQVPEVVGKDVPRSDWNAKRAA
jgi:hypothetical protein